MNILQKIWRAIVPYYVRKRICYYNVYGGHKVRNELLNRALEVGRKGRIKVLFIAANLPMWRAQGLYELLLKDRRFDARVIVTPFERNSVEEAKTQADKFKELFSARRLEAPKAVVDEGFDLDKWLEDFNPDVIFPCQQYEIVHGNALDLKWNMHRLQVFIPYGIPTMKHQFVYNTTFHNQFLRIYHATDLHLKSARRLMCNNAENVRIVGEIDFDKFQKASDDPWKKIDDGHSRKRIIWAPHFTIHGGYIHRAGFLWLCDEMLEIAREYATRIQIAFKPHPHLYSVLCQSEMWGKDRTDKYYELWASMANTQLETGEFADLFRFSDAMVHDCASFTGEYMFVRKPVMFTSKEIRQIRKDADDYGAKCLDMHYIGKSADDVRRFIEEVVLAGNDPMEQQRTDFYNRYLLPPNGRSVAENIYHDMVEIFNLPSAPSSDL